MILKIAVTGCKDQVHDPEAHKYMKMYLLKLVYSVFSMITGLKIYLYNIKQFRI